MKPILLMFAAGAAMAGNAAVGQTATPARRAVVFNRDVRPILSNNCFFCHGPDAKHREAELRLDTREGLMGKGSDGPIVVAGKPSASELWKRITSHDDDVKMPPADSRRSLKPEQVELIRSWIEQGAEWTDHWSFTRVVRPPVPPTIDKAWPRNAVDRFVLARLETENIKPSPSADPITLVRRLHADLHGLPPSREVVEKFRRDSSDKSYQGLVNALLMSPHFGERLAVYWLDLVRYADSVGYHGDQEHAITPYRDYVIQAFNDNMPFDRFTMEQLAGDLLPTPTIDQRIATGYNRVLQTSHEGGVQQREYLTKYSADRVRNVSSVWLGITMGCAECHDHKYDPIAQRDFYSLAAFFADVDDIQTFRGSNTLPTTRLPELKVLSPPDRLRLTRLQQIERDLARQLETAKATSPPVAEKIKRLQAGIDQQRKLIQELESRRRRTMVTVAVKPRPIRLLNRGDWMDQSGPVVEPAVPGFLGRLSKDGRANRMDLALWLTHRDNPLTAHVFVNRLWKMFFGKGISKRLDDVGSQGETPMHPELLDWLAAEFMESGWNIKHVVKLMVMSSAYRQSSSPRPELREVDPENRLIARQSRYRIEAEFIRDSVLSVSGLLVTRVGGKGARPYQPAGYYQHLNFPKRTYQADNDDNQFRRGVYTHWQRVFLHPMLKAFDAPSREECTAERPRSNTPLGALVLLNSPTTVEAARKFAERIIREGGEDTSQRLRWAWQEALSRSPSPQELPLMKRLVETDRREYQRQPESARQLLAVGISPQADGIEPAELAAWTAAARALFNLHEFINRN